MFIFVVMFISCLVYLFNLVLLKIEAVAANESDSGIGAVTFGDPVRDATFNPTFTFSTYTPVSTTKVKKYIR